METSIFSLAFILLMGITLSSSKTLYNSTTDQYSLLSFKTGITSDPRGVLSRNWSTSTPFCNWTGVSCSVKHNRVTALNLSGFELQGTISPHLGNLTFLQSLDISSNNFTGSLPSELAKLFRLEEIKVNSNELTGEIPSGILNNMSSLVEIDMSNNQLSGEIPDDMCGGDLPKLRRLDLTGNRLSGRIPASMYRCRMMEELWLDGNQFSGKIVNEIGNLTVLRELSFNSNNMEGEIPSSISNISTLQYVDFYNNSFSGSVPVFYNSLKLEQLYLNLNAFTGTIPKEIGRLTSLTYLKLSSNNLTGPIPKQLGNLTSLIFLDLAYNKLSGELPEELGNLESLEVLAAPFNDFLNGSIPSSIFNISSLNTIALMQNQFSGSLPPDMGISLPNLEQLYLYFNRLTGEIPTSIVNASKLTVLELNRNSFTGSIPDFGNLRNLRNLRLWENNLTGEESPDKELRFLSSLTACRNLEVLEFSDNPHLNGVLPSSIGNLSTYLVSFWARTCGITGAIPSVIGNLISLQRLDLSENKLTGLIPTTIGKLNRIVNLNFYGNRLEGYIPRHLCEMTALGYLYLGSNSLTGSIPECLGEVKSLRNVSFASNKLNSTFPSRFLNLVDLVFLDLSSNNLSGELPFDIGRLIAVNELDLSSNRFSGNIPDSFSTCKSLELLNLSDNTFTGPIPGSLEDIKGLIVLDLHDNELSGSIPKSLEKLDLHDFNVSNNKLEGEIPDGGCFANFSGTSFLNNPALCGMTRFQYSPCSGRSTSKSFSLVMKYILPPFVAVTLLLAGTVLLLRRRKKKSKPSVDETLKDLQDWMRVSERDLIQATDSFSEEKLLGKGGIGSVYRATLTVTEKDVEVKKEFAVKVFDAQVEGASKIFETECRILSGIRHRNLVKVHGCCSNMNTDFKALILAYMPNGSLETWLHSEKYFVDLVQRLKIAIDVALALEYLHHEHVHTVVHCDIKPSNVLLDEDMTAHVGDFGISKLFDDGTTEAITKRMATIGYAAPEVGEGKVSTRGDVYSYGILLLEMFTNKRPTDDMFGPGMSLKDWVMKALQEEAISEIVAPGLVSREDPHFPGKLRCISSIFELAMICLASSPQERVNMMQVVGDLQKIKVPVEEVKKKHRR